MAFRLTRVGSVAEILPVMQEFKEVEVSKDSSCIYACGILTDLSFGSFRRAWSARPRFPSMCPRSSTSPKTRSSILQLPSTTHASTYVTPTLHSFLSFARVPAHPLTSPVRFIWFCPDAQAGVRGRAFADLSAVRRQQGRPPR